MKAYYINLAHRTDRRATMEARFAAAGIAAERVNALTPADITPDQKARYCNSDNRRWKSAPELSCSLTHVKIMGLLIASGDAMAAIFEDDAMLSPGLGAFLDAYEKADLEIDLLHLETDNNSVRMPPEPEAQLGEFGFYRLYSAGGGSAGYVCTRKAALRVVEGEEIRAIQTDQALFAPGVLSRELVTRQLVPALVIQDDRFGVAPGERRPGSDLESLRQQRGQSNNQNFWGRLHHNVHDLVVRDIIGANRNRWLGLTQGIAKRRVLFKTE